MSEVESLTTDPVCGMIIEKTETTHSAEQDGDVYYFCTKECKHQFEIDPHGYVPQRLVS